MKKLFLLTIIIMYSLLLVGQTATFKQIENKEIKGKIEHYISKDNYNINIGDTLILGTPSNMNSFVFILQNMPFENVPLYKQGNKIVLTKMRVVNKRYIEFSFKNLNKEPNMFKNLVYIKDIEAAIFHGEIKFKNFLSVSKALENLKLEKEKYELGLISEKEYIDKKNYYSKFILK